MSILLFPIGLALPTILGWLALRTLEASTPIFLRAERWLLASVLGVTLFTYLAFLGWYSGLTTYSFLGLLLVQVLGITGLGLLWFKKREAWSSGTVELAETGSLTKNQKIIGSIALVWVTIKIVAGFAMLTATPPYIDDVFNNWNMRGKIYHLTEEHVISYMGQNEMLSVGGTLSYPASVPLFKAWLTHINGSWHEGLVNAVHMWWYVVALLLMYSFLRRKLSRAWSAGGAYVLSSLPLYLMHGTYAYADLYLSLHLFAALMPLVWAALRPDPSFVRSCLHVSAAVTALLIYTKNEALMLHLPTMSAVYGGVLWHFHKQGTISIKRQLLWFAALVGAVLIPWVLFKWFSGLPFGNAKSVSGLGLKWHSGVAYAITINTFFEGNWNLLFPLLFGLLLWKRHVAFASATTVLVAYFLILYLGQLPIYFFTSIAHEALNQTGYARGLIQLVPVVVTITVLLAENVLRKSSQE